MIDPFPNLAANFAPHGDWARAARKNTAIVADELKAAGIPLVADEDPDGEVMSGWRGELQFDGAVVVFRRAWSYWRVSIRNGHLPLAAALALHEAVPAWTGGHGKVVRVNGHCGAPAPEREIRSWHVDSAEGLRMLVLALRAGIREDQMTPLTWWPPPPSTRDIVEAAVDTDADGIDRGWEWARATRDAAVREGCGRWHAAWNRAAEVALACALLRPEAGVMVTEVLRG